MGSSARSCSCVRLSQFFCQCIAMAKIPTLLVFLVLCLVAVQAVDICPGDTRGDRRCNHDSTHRVCAIIGVKKTSFWKFTGQTSWCGTIGHYGGKYGELPRCPPSKPSWCICKWATASWIKGQGCDASIKFNCAATDVCNLKLLSEEGEGGRSRAIVR